MIKSFVEHFYVWKSYFRPFTIIIIHLLVASCNSHSKHSTVFARSEMRFNFVWKQTRNISKKEIRCIFTGLVHNLMNPMFSFDFVCSQCLKSEDHFVNKSGLLFMIFYTMIWLLSRCKPVRRFISDLSTGCQLDWTIPTRRRLTMWFTFGLLAHG